MVKCVQAWFPMFICAINKHSERKKSIGQTSYGESYRGRSAGPPDRLPPLDILRMGVARWTVVLGCVWLGHRFITNHGCAQDVKRSYPVPPKTGSCTLIIKKWNLRS